MLDNYISESLLMVLIASGVPLLCCSISGLVVAVLQTATQIQEQSIVYLVKFCTVVGVFALLADWFCTEMIKFFGEVFKSVALLGRL